VKKSYKASKGMSSKTNVPIMSKAQSQPLPTPTIDVTKPISMILPDKPPKTVTLSLTSEDTMSDSSLQRIFASRPQSVPAMYSESQEVISDDNSTLYQLSYHIFGDAFTSSRLNSPVEPINNATPMHVETEIIIPPTSSQNLEPQILENISEPQISEQHIEIPYLTIFVTFIITFMILIIDCNLSILHNFNFNLSIFFFKKLFIFFYYKKLNYIYIYIGICYNTPTQFYEGVH
jgi:hypothetical protein